MRTRLFFVQTDVCRFFLMLGLLSVATPVGAHGVLKLENGNWYRDGAFHAETWYSVDGVLQESFAGDTEAVDLEGKFVIPPFGDAHRHGFTGSDFERDSQASLRTGVFHVANPNSILDRTREARVAARLPESVDVRYSHGGLTSPGGHPRQIYDGLAKQLGVEPASMEGQAFYEIADRAGLEARWPQILAAGPDFVKVMLERSEFHGQRKADPAFYGRRGLDPDLLPRAVELAHAAGLRVSVHVSSRVDFLCAVDSGADEIAHLPLERVEPADAQRAADADVTVVTTTVSHRPTDGVEDVDGLHRHNLAVLRERKVRLVLGTDSGVTVLAEAANLLRLGAFTERELLDLLCVDTPRWIFPQRAIGGFTAGAEASLLLLAADPLEDLTALDHVELRVKQGHRIEIVDLEEKPGVADALVHLVMSQGVEAALAEYHRMRAEEAEQWDFSEAQLNALGYELLNHGKIDDAIAVFELNAEIFADGANAWDSLGEAYMLQGDHETAIRHYRRSLELNPQNPGARAKLAEMGVKG